MKNKFNLKFYTPMKSFLLGFALVSVMFITACCGTKGKTENVETTNVEVVEQVVEEVTETVDTVAVVEQTTETVVEQ
jgi:hypothetical protein